MIFPAQGSLDPVFHRRAEALQLNVRMFIQTNADLPVLMHQMIVDGFQKSKKHPFSAFCDLVHDGVFQLQGFLVYVRIGYLYNKYCSFSIGLQIDSIKIHKKTNCQKIL